MGNDNSSGERESGVTRHSEDEPPPFLGHWRRVYFSILWYLAALIIVLYIITRFFRY